MKKFETNLLNAENHIALMTLYRDEWKHRDQMFISLLWKFVSLSLIITFLPNFLESIGTSNELASKLPIAVHSVAGIVCSLFGLLIGIEQNKRITNIDLAYKALGKNPFGTKGALLYMAYNHVSVRSARRWPRHPNVGAVCVAPLCTRGACPLRRFAAIPYLCGKLNIIPYDRFVLMGKTVFFYFQNSKSKEVRITKKSREELQKEHDEAVTKREQYLHQCQRLENRIHYYTEGERKKRNHRLITRGAEVESVVPEVRSMSQSGFRTLVEQIFSLPEVTDLVRRAIDQQEGD